MRRGRGGGGVRGEGGVSLGNIGRDIGFVFELLLKHCVILGRKVGEERRKESRGREEEEVDM